MYCLSTSLRILLLLFIALFCLLSLSFTQAQQQHSSIDSDEHGPVAASNQAVAVVTNNIDNIHTRFVSTPNPRQRTGVNKRSVPTAESSINDDSTNQQGTPSQHLNNVNTRDGDNAQPNVNSFPHSQNRINQRLGVHGQSAQLLTKLKGLKTSESTNRSNANINAASDRISRPAIRQIAPIDESHVISANTETDTVVKPRQQQNDNTDTQSQSQSKSPSNSPSSNSLINKLANTRSQLTHVLSNKSQQRSNSVVQSGASIPIFPDDIRPDWATDSDPCEQVEECSDCRSGVEYCTRKKIGRRVKTVRTFCCWQKTETTAEQLRQAIVKPFEENIAMTNSSVLQSVAIELNSGSTGTSTSLQLTTLDPSTPQQVIGVELKRETATESDMESVSGDAAVTDLSSSKSSTDAVTDDSRAAAATQLQSQIQQQQQQSIPLSNNNQHPTQVKNTSKQKNVDIQALDQINNKAKSMKNVASSIQSTKPTPNNEADHKDNQNKIIHQQNNNNKPIQQTENQQDKATQTPIDSPFDFSPPTNVKTDFNAEIQSGKPDHSNQHSHIAAESESNGSVSLPDSPSWASDHDLCYRESSCDQCNPNRDIEYCRPVTDILTSKQLVQCCSRPPPPQQNSKQSQQPSEQSLADTFNDDADVNAIAFERQVQQELDESIKADDVADLSITDKSDNTIHWQRADTQPQRSTTFSLFAVIAMLSFCAFVVYKAKQTLDQGETDDDAIRKFITKPTEKDRETDVESTTTLLNKSSSTLVNNNNNTNSNSKSRPVIQRRESTDAATDSDWPDWGNEDELEAGMKSHMTETSRTTSAKAMSLKAKSPNESKKQVSE